MPTAKLYSFVSRAISFLNCFVKVRDRQVTCDPF